MPAIDVDLHVGRRIRLRRRLKGLTLQDLADAVGVRYQQVQKYETGVNRLTAKRVWEFAKALDVPILYFYEGMEGDEGQIKLPEIVDGRTDAASMELIRTYHELPDNEREQLRVFARKLRNATKSNSA